MPSFDIVSKVKKDEIQNAVDNASRELSSRYDFRGTESSFSLSKEDLSVKLDAPEEFHIQQMDEILRQKLAKRGIEAASAEFSAVTRSGKRSIQKVTFKQGIDRELAKKIIKTIKDAKLKVDPKVFDDAVRVSGKKRDDLQSAIALVRSAGFEQPLQYENFRD
ncbi:MAG: YajQ family cyclic di-GMP-binding protein [Succinatimonas sp.]|nr:YajQ family cyclic di-GMP-binding protein [Succinatimonas sp.]